MRSFSKHHQIIFKKKKTLKKNRGSGYIIYGGPYSRQKNVVRRGNKIASYNFKAKSNAQNV